jgi:hypothetical protein
MALSSGLMPIAPMEYTSLSMGPDTIPCALFPSCRIDDSFRQLFPEGFAPARAPSTWSTKCLLYHHCLNICDNNTWCASSNRGGASRRHLSQ